AVLCHCRIAANRPDPVFLPQYYSWIALGGALGGVTNTLVAPLLFRDVFEYPLAFCLPLFFCGEERREMSSPFWRELWRPLLLSAVTVGIAMKMSISSSQSAIIEVGLLVGLVIFAHRVLFGSMRLFATLVLMIVVGGISSERLGVLGQPRLLFAKRNFF